MAESEKLPYYEGLPIPVQASVIVTFILTFEDPSWFDGLALGSLSVLIPMVIITSALMVTTVQFTAIPKLTAGALQSRAWAVAGFGSGLVLTLLFQEAGLFAAMIGYIVINVGRSIYTFARAVWSSG
jgi:CDP-diacylglycerol--serine O-phosphatidyltransferase